MQLPVRRLLLACLVIGLGLGGCAGSVPRPSTAPGSKAYAYAVISVADMDQALALWSGRLGMRIAVRREGSDPGLAAVWGVDARGIIDQVLLLAPGTERGGIHLVRFRVPGAAVREGAASADLVPKGVGIAVHDLPARLSELEAAGYRVRESQLSGTDGVDLMFFERAGGPQRVSAQDHGVPSQVVLVAADDRRDELFLERVLGLDAIDRPAGPSPGAAPEVRIFGDRLHDHGRLKIVRHPGSRADDLYPRARPPARGLLSVTYFVPDVDAVLARAAELRSASVDHGVVDTVFGKARMATLTAPTGLRIDLVQR